MGLQMLAGTNSCWNTHIYWKKFFSFLALNKIHISKELFIFLIYFELNQIVKKKKRKSNVCVSLSLSLLIAIKKYLL